MEKRKPNPEYQRRYYQEHREKRLRQAIEYQREHRTERKAYLAEYYKHNRGKWMRTQEQKDERNRRRRERYATDEKFRLAKIEESKETRKRNPDTRLKHCLKKYGVSIEEYRKLESKGCAICGRKKNGDRRGHRFHIDHAHNTGHFRGILCTGCNQGLGKFCDDPERLERAAMYLRASVRGAQTRK